MTLENVRLFLKENDVAGTKWAQFAEKILPSRVSRGAPGRSEFGAFQRGGDRIEIVGLISSWGHYTGNSSHNAP
jgi:hypothetical protein